MLSAAGVARLTYRRLGHAELHRILSLDFLANQIDRYLGALDGIVAAIRRGPAHHLIGIEENDALIGFYAIHPDRRDASRWWLG